jgi:hypothetical protein
MNIIETLGPRYIIFGDPCLKPRVTQECGAATGLKLYCVYVQVTIATVKEKHCPKLSQFAIPSLPIHRVMEVGTYLGTVKYEWEKFVPLWKSRNFFNRG